MPEKHKTNIISLGVVASDTIHSATTATVIGITSKGVFAITPDKHILFLTNETYRGPLTINLHNFNHQQLGISFNSTLLIFPAAIQIENKDIVLLIDHTTKVWSPPIIPPISPSYIKLLDRVQMLENLPDWQSIREFSLEIHTLFKKIHPDIRSGKFRRVAEKLEAIIGFGTGLTPSGDDFICGFLLAAYYWHAQILTNFPFEKIKDHLLDIAQQTTTTLSANLITCAAQGSADERILACLHWINNGEGDIETIIKELRGYGSSSGFDTLLGMLMFIRAALDHE